MYRLVKMTGTWYAVKFNDLEDEIEPINNFLSGGEIVVITDDLETFAEEFDIELEDIKMA